MAERKFNLVPCHSTLHPSLPLVLSAALALSHLSGPSFWPPCPVDSSSVLPKQPSRPFSKLKSDLPLKHLKMPSTHRCYPTACLLVLLLSPHSTSRPASLHYEHLHSINAMSPWHYGRANQNLEMAKWRDLHNSCPASPNAASSPTQQYTIPYSSLAARHTVN